MRYIGSKINLISDIRSIVNHQAPRSKIFCDLFAGTGVVGREFKASHQIISNDILHFAYVLNVAYNGLSSKPGFSKLVKKLHHDPISYLNKISICEDQVTEEDFMTISYSPAGAADRKYLTVSNALKIDRIRQTIAQWFVNDDISEDEFFYLLASLIEKVPSVSNTTGTYGAFLKNWDTRSYKPLIIDHLYIQESQYQNKVFNLNANDLIHRISGDVLYLDTPYNARQYSSNYHLLETLARYDKPELKGLTGLRADKTGESSYCRKNSVYQSFDDLLGNADFKSIVISYSSDGILSEEQLIEIMSKHGNEKTLNMKKLPYRRYKRVADDERNVLEYLFAIDK
jgi:adenine-specific DNA-methyltransferase